MRVVDTGYKTSLKFQKFTWPLACVYISFAKLKNICTWSLSVYSKPEGYFHDSPWFFMFYSSSWMFYHMFIKKNIDVLLHFLKNKFMFFYI